MLQSQKKGPEQTNRSTTIIFQDNLIDDGEDSSSDLIIDEDGRELDLGDSIQVLSLLRKISEKELARILELYTHKEFSADHALDLYKTLLILFEVREANKGISQFLRHKNVRN